MRGRPVDGTARHVVLCAAGRVGPAERRHALPAHGRAAARPRARGRRCGAVDTAGNCTTLLATAELFEPTTGTWTPTGTMATARYVHGAAALLSGEVLILGGWDGTDCTSDVEIYDPVSGTFRPGRPMTAGRCSVAALTLASGRVLVAGGWSGLDAMNAAEVYDPATGAWTGTWPMTAFRVLGTLTRRATAAARCRRHRRLVDHPLGRAVRWRRTAGRPQARCRRRGAGAAWQRPRAGRGRVRDTAYLSTAEVYDPTAGAVKPAVFPCRGTVKRVRPADRAGAGVRGWSSSGASTRASCNPAAGWARPARWPAPRRARSGCCQREGACRGRLGRGGILADAELYDSGAAFYRVCPATGPARSWRRGRITANAAPATQPAPARPTRARRVAVGPATRPGPARRPRSTDPLRNDRLSGLDGPCRTYSDLTANRCLAAGAF